MSAPSSAPTAATKPLEALNQEEWEALCDGCGKCCLAKLEDEDSGEIHYTDVGCRQLDVATGRCRHYTLRGYLEESCVQLSPALIRSLPWLPNTCAYRLRAAGSPLPDWHPLISGDPDSVRRAGVSVAGRAVSHRRAGDLLDHLADWPCEAEAPAGRRRA